MYAISEIWIAVQWMGLEMNNKRTINVNSQVCTQQIKKSRVSSALLKTTICNLSIVIFITHVFLSTMV